MGNMYFIYMDDAHFLNTQIPQTPWEKDCFRRLEAAVMTNKEEVTIAEQAMVNAVEELEETKQDMHTTQIELDARCSELVIAENRIELLEGICNDLFDMFDKNKITELQKQVFLS